MPILNTSTLEDKSTVLIFTYAPAGLGHMRVTNAFYNGLPEDVSPVLLGSHDKSIGRIHNFISIHSFTRKLMEDAQNGEISQYLFTKTYRKNLRKKSKVLYQQFKDVLSQRMEVPKKVVIVASHFGLAHQISVIKGDIEANLGVKVYLIVQVTDASPQYIWYVPGSDLTFVPSKETKEVLEAYGKKVDLPPVKFKVLPYPISPILNQKLSDKDIRSRKNQLVRDTSETINVCLPVSGAAVHTEFFIHLIENLHKKSSKFKFHVISRDVPFTKEFLAKIRDYPNVESHSSKHDREVVDFYVNTYKKNVISLEVTKPSEQAFKALYNSDCIGGSLLLFSHPVGRQEYDNLDFLRKHSLIPSREETEKLWDKAEKGISIGENELSKIFEGKDKVRGIELPLGSEKCGNFIWWCINYGVFETIFDYGMNRSQPLETLSNGVDLFWDEVNEFISLN